VLISKTDSRQRHTLSYHRSLPHMQAYCVLDGLHLQRAGAYWGSTHEIHSFTAASKPSLAPEPEKSVGVAGPLYVNSGEPRPLRFHHRLPDSAWMLSGIGELPSFENIAHGFLARRSGRAAELPAAEKILDSSMLETARKPYQGAGRRPFRFLGSFRVTLRPAFCAPGSLRGSDEAARACTLQASF